MKDVVQKYLRTHAVVESKQELTWDTSFKCGVVIPASMESRHLDLALDHVFAAAPFPVLAMIVVNGREDALEQVHRINLQWLQTQRQRLAHVVDLPMGGYFGFRESHGVLVIDRASEGHRFSAKQGVGLARKIGADLALRLWSEGVIQNPWIRFLDADTRVGSDYFFDEETMMCEESRSGRMNEDKDECVAWTYPFIHDVSGVDSKTAQAHQLYEQSLHYYVQGLSYAGSPYAFHTIGSIIAVHALAYAKVRGVPLRLAGEDFYLLNKLRKIGSVKTPRVSPMVISARQSDRVPFGTGPAVASILAEGTDKYRMYHPMCFEVLRYWLQAIPAHIDGHTVCVPDPLEPVMKEVSERWLPGLLVSVKQRKTNEEKLRQAHVHFDAFQTLKMVHYVRDYYYPSLPWQDAIETASFYESQSQGF